MNQITPLSRNGDLSLIKRELARDPRIISPHTVRGYTRDLELFLDWRKGRDVTKLVVEEYAAHLLQEGKRPASVNRALSAIRWWAHKLSDIAQDNEHPSADKIAERAARVIAIRDVQQDDDIQKGRHISGAEVGRLLSACDQDFAAGKKTDAAIRDAAMIALAYSTGMRVAEIASLKINGVTWSDDGETLKISILGKRRKHRDVYVSDKRNLIARWMVQRWSEPGPFFLAVGKSGKMRPGKGLSTTALSTILHNRATQAGLEKPMTWHDFRRTLAGNLLDAGTDLVTVQKILGHASSNTTSKYDRRGDRAKAKAAETIFVPEFW